MNRWTRCRVGLVWMSMWGISACRADESSAPVQEQVAAVPPAEAAASSGGPAEGAPALDDALAEAEKLDLGGPAFPPDERPLRVLILGDSLVATGFGALLERRLDKNPEIECFRRAKSATGLARPDFFDWMSEAKVQVEKHDPHLVIVVMGGNDGQDLQPLKKGDAPRVHWQKPEWEGAYRQRMDEFLALVSAPDRRVLWLGLPTMGIESFEKKLTLIRKVQQEAIAALGAAGAYLDTAPFVSDGSGQMLAQAEVGGRMQTIRDKDRIHFTMAGSEYFANAVYPQVLKVLGVEEQPEPAAKGPADAPTGTAEVAQATPGSASSSRGTGAKPAPATANERQER